MPRIAVNSPKEEIASRRPTRITRSTAFIARMFSNVANLQHLQLCNEVSLMKKRREFKETCKDQGNAFSLQHQLTSYQEQEGNHLAKKEN